MKATIQKDVSRANHKLIQLKGKYQDLFTISYYDTRTLLLQGKPLELFQEGTRFLEKRGF